MICIYFKIRTTLNPPHRKETIREAFRAGGTPSGEIRERSIDLLTTLQIAAPADTMKRYPHELSGGMAQRVVIAMALAQKTSVIIADECTTSLDPVSAVSTVEALQSARQSSGCSILFITHDEGIATTYSDRILRFDKGRFVDGGTFS
jgi:ABC-type glutathione transport system ATPase component